MSAASALRTRVVTPWSIPTLYKGPHFTARFSPRVEYISSATTFSLSSSDSPRHTSILEKIARQANKLAMTFVCTKALSPKAIARTKSRKLLKYAVLSELRRLGYARDGTWVGKEELARPKAPLWGRDGEGGWKQLRLPMKFGEKRVEGDGRNLVGTLVMMPETSVLTVDAETLKKDVGAAVRKMLAQIAMIGNKGRAPDPKSQRAWGAGGQGGRPGNKVPDPKAQRAWGPGAAARPSSQRPKGNQSRSNPPRISSS
ncbi:hypothetical protein BJ508DRAFT_415534 [Ascobolus immersus RN42]|uniref:Uncharacterized protein n=1 Tax=Ascobolus immersus RN42 TaxID=1160509 RepID=A0A3N4I7N6_ASCIM|nr:hypothetical protein BJ508DRAFT_415534 [Ascobolus immersus RN42]